MILSPFVYTVAEQKGADHSDAEKVMPTKLNRFQSRVKIDADSGAKVYWITSCSYRREADPHQFCIGSKVIRYRVHEVLVPKLPQILKGGGLLKSCALGVR